MASYGAVIIVVALCSTLVESKLAALCSDNPSVLLPDDYDPYTLPLPGLFDGSNATGPVRVFTDNLIRDITAINDKTQAIDLPILSLKSWRDPRIKARGKITEQIIPGKPHD